MPMTIFQCPIFGIDNIITVLQRYQILIACYWYHMKDVGFRHTSTLMPFLKSILAVFDACKGVKIRTLRYVCTCCS